MLDKKNYTLPKFRVYISDKCQLNCQFCGGNKGHMESFQPEYICSKTSDEEIMTIIKSYIKNGGNDIQLTGGEPLIKENIVSLVKRIVELEARVEINTNAVALTESMAKQLYEAGLKEIKVSMPAFTREDYKLVTGKDYFDLVCDNLRKASEYLSIRVNTVATNKNMAFLDNMILFCKKYNIKRLGLLELCYYPDLMTYSYFKEQHIDFLKDYSAVVEEKLHGQMKRLPMRADFKTPVYYVETPERDFCISYKCANPVFRCEACEKCATFCQEGLYQLRLSEGGYLNFCNFPSSLGIELAGKTADMEYMNQVFENMSKVWDSIYEGNPEAFYQYIAHNNS